MSSITPIRKTKHGKWKTPEFRVWVEMRRRCRDMSGIKGRHYAQKGIKVCERWEESFVYFLEDMGERPSPRHQIDRINPEGNYEPSNCRWVTSLDQQNNRRKHTRITINGVTKNANQWWRETGLPNSTFYNRLRLGWTGEKLLEPQVKSNAKRYYDYRGQSKTLSEWSRVLGIHRNTLDKRINILNWDLNKAFKK